MDRDRDDRENLETPLGISHDNPPKDERHEPDYERCEGDDGARVRPKVRACEERGWVRRCSLTV
jgi:hypothetical protein